MTDATLPAAVPLRLPPRSAYAAPSSKSSKSTQRLKSSLTYYPIRPFAPLHVCMKDLTADIFHGRSACAWSCRCKSYRKLIAMSEARQGRKVVTMMFSIVRANIERAPHMSPTWNDPRGSMKHPCGFRLRAQATQSR